jgi:hypothetical protein
MAHLTRESSDILNVSFESHGNSRSRPRYNVIKRDMSSNSEVVVKSDTVGFGGQLAESASPCFFHLLPVPPMKLSGALK